MRESHRIRRLLALTLTLLIVLPLSLLAARWQWNRHIERETRNELITAAERQAISPVARLAPASELDPAFEWRLVRATGTFEATTPVLWRKQPMDGQPGFVAFAKLRTADSPPVLVALGWLRANGRNPAEPPPTLPRDAVEVSGYLRPLPNCSSIDPADLPAGQTNCPTTLLVDTDARYYLQATTAAAPLMAVGLPELDAGPHLGYVGQWLLIGLTAIITYVSLLRRIDELPAGSGQSRQRD